MGGVKVYTQRASWRLVVSFTPLPLYPRTHWIGGCVGPRAGLDGAGKTIFLTLTGLELQPVGHPVRGQSLYRLRYRGSIQCTSGIDDPVGELDLITRDIS
jgi:hypothetical protein